MTSTPRVQRLRQRRASGITAVVPIEVTEHMLARLVAEGYLPADASRDAVSAALSKMLRRWAGAASERQAPVIGGRRRSRSISQGW